MPGDDVESADAKADEERAGPAETSVLFSGSTAWDLMGRSSLPVRGRELGMTEDGRELLAPELVPALEGKHVTKLVSGPTACHVLALTASGDVYAWGRNESGQLGLGDTRRRNCPTLVTAVAGRRIVGAAAGRNHTLLLTADGAVLACGANKCGQLGVGSLARASAASPADVELAALDGAKAVGVGAGGEFSVIVGDDGALYSFGLPEYGQLGHGTDGKYIEARKEMFTYEAAPRKIASLVKDAVKIVAVACGSNSSVALDAEGRIYTWGWGSCMRARALSPSAQAAALCTALTLDGRFLPALLSAGTAGCPDGRLGHSKPHDEFTPRQVDKVSKATAVYAGASFHYAVTQFKQCFFWGQSKKSGEATMYPKVIHDLMGWDVRSIAAGPTSTLLCADTSVVSWGPAPCYGELCHGVDEVSRTGHVVKSSPKPKLVARMEGAATLCVAVGLQFSALLVRRATPEDARVLDACPVLDEVDADADTGPAGPAGAAAAGGRKRAAAAPPKVDSAGAKGKAKRAVKARKRR
jgi:alpha-tubulin suppressor-like RCC1 family protein